MAVRSRIDLRAAAKRTAPQFGEASINLTTCSGTNCTQNSLRDVRLGSVKTRYLSGSGGTAELKDFILPAPIHVSNCGAITIHKTVPGS